MIEIFFDNRVVYLTDEKEEFYAQFENREQLKNLIDKFIKGDYKHLYIAADDLNNLFQNFKSLFIFEKAAGGLVVNSMHKILAIKNRGIWQLPKGHVEPGETYQEAAIREVEEECGIKNPTIIKQLPSTFHTFLEDGKMHLKQTFWFKMLYKGFEKLSPLSSEGITEAVWIDRKELDEILKNTYENLKPIWRLA